MNQEKILTGKAPHINITECNGDLVVRTWAETAVSLKGENFEVNQTDEKISITSQRELKLTIPIYSSLTVGYVNGDVAIKLLEGDVELVEVNGDAVLTGLNNVTVQTLNADLSAKNLNGELTLDMVNGDVALRNIGELTVHTVQGDMAARNVNGSATLHQAFGDVSLRTVNGDVTIDNGMRDVNLRNIGGQVAVLGVQGDVRLYGGLSKADHSVSAERDIIVRWPLSAPLNLTATAPSIKNRLPLEKETEMENTLIGRLGDGQTNLTLTANGRILLKEGDIVDPQKWGEEGDFDSEFEFDFANFGSQVTQQINDQVSQITQRLETKLGPEFTQRMADKITRKVEQATARAEQAAARARERAERQRPPRPPRRPTPPTPPQKQKKASAEEQLKILKMVEQGLITPDEASMLLEALEK
ncbi:MAG: hypothetical protein KC434_01465 [Anaerolineales bacterium]|nr:hypothetical protein [Anaerolineales bacterium]